MKIESTGEVRKTPSIISEQFSPLNENLIIVHSGNDTVGGIVLEIIDKNPNFQGLRNSIFLDFGTRMDITARYGVESAPYHSGLFPLLLVGAVPPIPGIYREDILRGLTMEKLVEELKGKNGRINPERITQAINLREKLSIGPQVVLTTHHHWDHIGAISYLSPDLPISTTAITLKIIQAMEQHWGANWQREITFYRDRTSEKREKRGRLPIIERRVIPVTKGVILEINGFEIYYNRVDHSALDSCAISVILPNGQKIDYTGDIRSGEFTQIYAEKLRKEPPDVLIIDGTNVGINKPTFTEKDVALKFLELFNQDIGPFYIMTPQRHFERWSNIIKSAKFTARTVYVPLVVGFYINALQPYRSLDQRIPDINDIIVYLHPRGKGRYEEEDYPKALRDFAFSDNAVKVVAFDDLRGMGKDSVVILTSQSQLFNLFSHNLLSPGGIYIHSASEAHEEKGRIELNKIKRILQQVGYRYYFLHSSGHFSEIELYHFLRGINLENIRLVIPLHTNNPRRLSHMIESLSPVTKVVETIRQGLPFNFDGNFLS